MSSRAAALAACSRLPFVILAPLSAGLGLALALRHGVVPQDGRAIAVIAAALLAHVAVNLRNEAEDYTSGLDRIIQRTPFSGGSGFLPSHPQYANWVAQAGNGAILATAAIGAWLAYQQPWLWLLGAAGLLLVWFYTGWITRRPWLCAVAPGLAFGPIVVIGSELAMGGTINRESLLVSGAVFFVANNLLLLNQLPDADADCQIGRATLASAYPARRVRTVAVIFAASAAATAIGALADQRSLWLAVPLAALLAAALRATRVADELRSNGKSPTLALNTAAVLTLLAVLNALLWV